MIKSDLKNLKRKEFDSSAAVTMYYSSSEARAEVMGLLAQEGLDDASIDDLAVSLSINEIEKLDRLIAAKQVQLERTLRELESRTTGRTRTQLAPQLLEMEGSEVSVVPEK